MKAGRSEDMKQRLTEEIVKSVVSALGSAESSVSVAIEDVPADEWTPRVYDGEIAPNWERLYKKPGYGAGAGRGS
jgi:4-oxalocrotonate tautomerase